MLWSLMRNFMLPRCMLVAGCANSWYARYAVQCLSFDEAYYGRLYVLCLQ